MIFPEACTSNGEYLISFKKGAFANLKPVKPYINRTVSPRISQVMGSVMNLWHWVFIIPFHGGFYRSENLEMPVFAPNDYFWEHYWDGKDPDHQAEPFLKLLSGWLNA